MAFPISIDGTLSLPKSHDVSGLSSSIVDALNKASVISVSTQGNTISFKAGMFRLVGNWNPLSSVGSGTIFITDSEIKYHLNLKQMFVFATLSMTLAFGLFMIDGGPIFVPPVGWLFFVGAGYVDALISFPSFLKNALRRATLGSRLG